jgi:hypothetical protein
MPPESEEEEEDTRPLPPDGRRPFAFDHIELTREEAAVVHRLGQLAIGIDRSTILQVFLICNRNEAEAQQCLISMI